MNPSELHRVAVPRARTLIVAIAVMLALPATALGARPHHVVGYNTDSAPFITPTGSVPGVEVVPLINSGDTVYGDMFQGIPDGIGVVPAPGNQGYVDMYVNHEQSHVPFLGLADLEDSSVSRVRVDVASQSVIDLDVALPASLGFIRFCSSFMAGPEQGFPKYTLLTNEESNDVLPVPAGAPYGADPALAPNRQAGYSVALDTVTGKVTTLNTAGRHNHENQVVVPGGWSGIHSLSGDDTFSAPSSQLYMFASDKWQHYVKGDGSLWAFQVTATGPNGTDPLTDASDPFNGANDYLDMQPGDEWSGRFIQVPDDVARGLTGDAPQTALENWSNENNVFQFVRIEDIDYDPDSPRTVYFADTGTSRLAEDPSTGRLTRLASGGVTTNGRVFRMELNANNPTVVDSFSILADALDVSDPATQSGPMRNPDNIDVGHDSIIVQEDTSSFSKIWMYSMADGSWHHVATVTVAADAESSGVLDVSRWFGAGWWALDVQDHVHFVATQPSADGTYTLKREAGQLMLVHIPGS